MIEFSFIIPHKNTPDLLRKCIDSIPHREGVQIIVVDDNSDSLMVDFEHFPGVGEPFTEVYLTKEGRGAGYARNVGLSHAVGKWIVFADADDFFTSNFDSFLDSHVSSTSDIVLWKTCCVDLDTGKPGFRGGNINRYTEEAIKTGFFENILLISTPVKGMYSAKLLADNGIRFNESRWGNDVVFSSKVALAVRTAEAYEDVVYCISSHSSFGLKSNPSVESATVRFKQEVQSVRIIRSRFRSNPNIHNWFFQSWFALYKFNKFTGLKYLPYAIAADGFKFVSECFKAKFC